jgi:heme oxygenase
MPRSELGLHLRAATTSAHQALETAVGFDLDRPSRARAETLMRCAYGLLKTLEPLFVARLPATVMDGRTKLDVLDADFARLGTLPPPPTHSATWHDAGVPTLMGALYVFEGSTLGGRLIVRALRTLEEWPIAGRCYLDPYGARTGEMWSRFQADLAQLPQGDTDAVVEGAHRAFAGMQADLELERAAC